MDALSAKRDTLTRLLLLAAVVCAFSFVYLPLFGRIWFFNDDPLWIWTSATTNLKDICFSPEKYRQMSPFFTPLLGISFKIDWMLFGMNPDGYYLHSLLSLCAAGTALYVFLRLYGTEASALTGVLLFVLSPLTLSITTWFAARHYLEGLSWSLLSLTLLVRSERKGRVSAASGIFYLLAALSKEVYVVVPVVAFLLSKGGFRARLKSTAPLWVALALYLPWRFWMLGGRGGYLDMQSMSLESLVPIFSNIVHFLSHLHTTPGAFLYVLFFAALVISVQGVTLRHVTRAFLILLVLIIPILPVSYRVTFSSRYFFHISLFMICLVSLLLEYPSTKKAVLRRGGALFVCLLLCIVFVKEDILMTRSIVGERTETKSEATRFITARDPYIKVALFVGFYEPLRKIYREFLGRDIKTQLVPIEKALRYCHPEKLREMRASGIDIPYEQILGFQKQWKDGPLSVRMTLSQYRLTWDFGPEKEKPYSLVAGTTSGFYYAHVSINPAGSLLFTAPDVFYIRVIYQKPGEEIAVVSPEFVLSIPGSQEIVYGKTD
jgi:hypothetical protein